MSQRRGYGREWFRRMTGRLFTDASVDGLPPIGLIAGWGSFPIEVAEGIVRNGRQVCCVAIKDHAAPELETLCDDVRWSGVGKVGGHIQYFRRRGIREVTLAGKLFKGDLLFQGSLWIKHCPDLTAIRTFGPCLLGRRRDARDDSLLLAVTAAYARHNLTIRPATDFAPELLVNEGRLAGNPLNEKQMRDAEFGWGVAKQMGGMDIGQSITIKDGTVLAVEAVEGTDACIERTGRLCPRGGWTLVKVSKPDQDMRFDVPTIGPNTIENVADNGGTAIVVEAEKTILVEREQTIELARRRGVSLVAFDRGDTVDVSKRAA